MKKPRGQAQRKREFRQLARQLASLDWMSEGYAQNRGPGAGGPCFQWSRKVNGKTVSVALSQEQFEALDKAIQNWRLAQSLLKQMQRLSREEIFTQLPGTKRRKALGKKVLGLI
jgi:L-2-hydroxyglutarate oxidase LhgO